MVVVGAEVVVVVGARVVLVVDVEVVVVGLRVVLVLGLAFVVDTVVVEGLPAVWTFSPVDEHPAAEPNTATTKHANAIRR